jgi:hypothetical protein
MWKEHNILLLAKLDTYLGETRVRYYVIRVGPFEVIKQNNLIIEELNKYIEFM